MGISWNGGTPLVIIQFYGIFPNKNHPAPGGYPNRLQGTFVALLLIRLQDLAVTWSKLEKISDGTWEQKHKNMEQKRERTGERCEFLDINLG